MKNSCPTTKEMQKAINDLEKMLDIKLPSAKEVLEPSDLKGGGKKSYTFDDLKKLQRVNEETFAEIRAISEKMLDILSSQKQTAQPTEVLEVALSAIANIDDEKIRTEDLDILIKHCANDKQRRALLFVKGKLINLDKIENDNNIGLVEQASMELLEINSKKDIEIAKLKSQEQIARIQAETNIEALKIMAQTHTEQVRIVNTYVIMKQRISYIIIIIFLSLSIYMGYLGYSRTDAAVELMRVFIAKFEGISVGRIPIVESSSWTKWLSTSTAQNAIYKSINWFLDCGGNLKAGLILVLKVFVGLLGLFPHLTGILTSVIMLLLGLVTVWLYQSNKVSFIGLSVENSTLLNLSNSSAASFQRLAQTDIYNKILPPTNQETMALEKAPSVYRQSNRGPVIEEVAEDRPPRPEAMALEYAPASALKPPLQSRIPIRTEEEIDD